MTTHTLRAESERLEVLLRDLDGHPDPTVGERLHEVVALLMQCHREALERVLSLAAEPALAGPALVGRLADDQLVAPLLLIHDLHPYGPEVRLSRALDRLRPQIAAHGCQASLLGVEDRVARLRLDGGARLSERSDLAATIRSSLLDVAPELVGITIETVSAPEPAAPLIQILKQPPAAAAVAKS